MKDGKMKMGLRKSEEVEEQEMKDMEERRKLGGRG